MIIFDILRIIAALMVFSIHLFIFIPTLPPKLCAVLSNGGYGVSIFFAMSGFLIFASLNRSKDLKEYYIKRIARIVPCYYAILVVGIIVWDIVLKQMPQDTLNLSWLRYFLFLNTWVPSNHYDSWNNLWGLWTIGCFMFFYLIAPFLKKIIKNFKNSVIFMIVMIIGSFVLAKGLNVLFENLNASMPNMLAVDNPIYSLNTFAMGICGWYGVNEHKEKEYLRIIILILTCFIGLNIYNRMTWGLLASLVMIGFIDYKINNDKLVSVIKTLSRYSFCLYMVHLPVMRMLEVGGISGAKFLLVATVLSCICAICLYHLVEKPFAGLIKKVCK